MLNKKLVITAVVVVALIGSIMLIKGVFSSKKGKKSAPVTSAKVVSGKKIVAKKAISKGKGGLTVRILNYKNAEIPMKAKIFKAVNADSSVYASSTVGGRMMELLPGTYDIELDTVPQKIFKNVKVNEGKETIKDLGCVTGALIVKTINAKKAPAYFPLRVLYGRTNDMVTAFMTNKPLEIIPGTYDIEIGTSPRQYKKDVRVEGGRESIVDMGCLTGTLIVRVKDENMKDVRCNVKVLKTGTNEMVSSSSSNKPVELGKGKYNIEVMSSPRQSKKDVTVNTAEESVVEFTVASPIIPQKVSRPTARPAKAKRQ